MKIQNDKFSLEISDDILKKLISQHSDPYDAQKQIFGFVQNVRDVSSGEVSFHEVIKAPSGQVPDEQLQAKEDVIAPEGYFYVVKFQESDFLSAIDYGSGNIANIKTDDIEGAWYSCSLSEAIEFISEYYRARAVILKYGAPSEAQFVFETNNIKVAPRIILVPESDLLPKAEQ